MATSFVMIVFISFLLSLSTNGNTIQTQFEYEYYNTSIQCIDGEDCQIKCHHSYSCQYSEIICPENYNCDLQFSASGAGQYAIIKAQDSNYLSITSSYSNALYLTDIYAPQIMLNLTCFASACPHTNIYANHTHDILIHCGESSSCSYLRLFADNVPNIDASCTGRYACDYMQIYHQSPPPSSKLNINCSINSCRYSLIRSKSDHLSINCASEVTTASGACYDANIYYESRTIDRNATVMCGVSACEQLDIYAPEGIFSVSVFGDTAQSNFVLHCGEIYHQSCDLQPDMTSNMMLCDDSAYCMNYKYDAATDYNIIVQDDYGKYNDTILCDPHFNDCTVYCDGTYSCAYSHIICPQNNPNATCTLFCGNYGCFRSIINAKNISSLTIYSTYSSAIQYASITASDLSHAVALHCDHSSACYDIELMATNIPQININCMASSACQLSDIYYTTDGDYYAGYEVPSNMIITCDGTSSCYQSDIHSNAGYLDIDCNGGSACYYTTLYCPESIVLIDSNDTNVYCDVSCGLTDSCIGLEVYSVNGWNNVRISSADDQFPESAQMHCDPAYSLSCYMQGNVDSDAWYCDQAEICSDYRVDLNATQMIIEREYKYYNESIQCAEDKDCYIYCNGRYSCAYTSFSCGNSNCSIYCIGDYSCYGAEINALTADILSIYSTGSQAAMYAVIKAPNNRLNMQCSDSSSSCQQQAIYATDTNEIFMDCLSSSSCHKQSIYAENTKVMEQYCSGSGSCYQSKLYQYSSPQSVDDEVRLKCYGSSSCYQYLVRTSLPLDVYCDSDASCQYTDLYILNNESLKLECVNEQSCRYINIYSVNGFVNRDLNITSYHDLYATSATFYCGSGQTKHCTLNGLINSNQWVCSDATNECYDYQLSEEDTDYILLNHNYKYADKFIHFDQNKTNCDIVCNADHSCRNAKGICPINTNNASCSVYCDASQSCSGLNMYAINGYSQLNMDCNGNDAYCSGITVLCTPYFNESCVFDSYGECIGFCSNYTYIATESVDLTFADNSYAPNASYIIASSPWKYYNRSIFCTGDTDSSCYIQCSDSYSCAYASIHFMGDDLNCYVSCAQYAACEYSVINGLNCSSLTIQGSSGSTLSRATIYPPSHVLNLHCSADRSCEYMKIVNHLEPTNTSLLDIYATCSASSGCRYQYWSIYDVRSVNIECSAQYACIHSDYFIYSVANVHWNCSGNYGCHLNIFNTDSPSCSIDCNVANACYQSELFLPEHAQIHCNHTEACKLLTIYTAKGSTALNIVSTANNSWSVSNEIYCGQSYIESCELQYDTGAIWNCDPSALCYEFDTNHRGVPQIT